MAISVALATLGCKVNQAEAEELRQELEARGYLVTGATEKAQVYVINTCTVTEKTDKESRRLIRKAHRQNPGAKVVVTGCYAELDQDEISASPCAPLIVRNEDKDRIADIIDSKIILSRRAKAKGYGELAISDFKARSKAFLKIQDGCNNFCSYCKVPLVRGRSRSRAEKAIIAEFERLVKKGFREIILTGICLGAWGEELAPKRDLADLIKKLTAIKGDFRIRLSSIEPKYVDNELLEVIKNSSKLCRHLHMPLQSGDDKILRMMNRPYTFREYAGIVQNARRKVPGIAITTDILIGFPSESDRNFRNTLKLVEKVKPSRIHIFPYSRREETVAATLTGEVPKDLVAKRMKVMKTLAERYSYEYRKKFIGKRAKVLVESERDRHTRLLKGYDDRYINIIIKGVDPKDEERCISQIVTVRIQKVDKNQTLATAT